MPPDPASPLRPGRPRQPGLEDTVLEATLWLIDHNQKITLDAVVQRSQVSRAAIYRRWESLSELLSQALDMGRTTPQVDFDGQLTQAAVFAALLPDPALFGSQNYPVNRLRKRIQLSMEHPQLQQAYWTHVERRRVAVISALEAAKAEGSLRADLDCEAAMDYLAGAFYYQIIVRGERLSNPATVARLRHGFDLLWRGMQA